MWLSEMHEGSEIFTKAVSGISVIRIAGLVTPTQAYRILICPMLLLH
jgi:hypothetical protein